MYPEDEQPPTNRNTIGEAPAPFSAGGQPEPTGQNPAPQQRPKKDKPNLWWLPWAICGFLFLLVAIFGVLWLTKNNSIPDDKKDTAINESENKAETENKDVDECTNKQRRYQNEDLALAFCYPITWGDVKVADGKLDTSDDGTRVRLSFADKKEVHLGLVSDDWATDVGRDGTCVDPAVQAFPDTSTFSAKWVNEPATGAPSSATRGLEVVPDEYLIQEHVDNLLTNGVCLEGYNAFGGPVYRNAAATYFEELGGTITTPQAHITDPTELIPAADRSEFITFVKSIRKL